MKTKFIYLILMASILSQTNCAAQALYLQWAVSFKGSGSSVGTSLAVNSNGDVYTTGSFNDTVDFDPGPGIYNVISPDTNYGDCFVAKITAAGNFGNAYWIGGMGAQDIGYGIATDPQNNVYTGGYFHATADFDPAPGNTFNLTSAGSADFFLTKSDAAGNFVWAKQVGDGGSQGCYDATVDQAGNCYAVGTWFNDLFLYKTNNLGDTLWTRRYAATQFINPGYAVTTDAAGNVYITGYHWGLNLFPNQGNTDVFIIKYDTDGNLLWAKTMGGPNQDFGNSLAVDDSGNVYTFGFFNSTVDFNPGFGASDTFFLTSAGARDVFVSKLDAGGNFVWARRAGGTGNDTSSEIVLDDLGFIYVAGGFAGTSSYGNITLTSFGNADAFIAKMDPAGNFIWAKQFGGTGADGCKGLAVDVAGNIYLSGNFNDTADFNPETGVYNLISAGFTDVFVLKLSQQPISIEENAAMENEIFVYPNPAQDMVTIKSKKEMISIQLYNALGEKILDAPSFQKSHTIDLSEIPPGVYMIEAGNKEHVATKKLIKQ
ncbi:MAG: SBBP repeat-containing protein [Bacteroidetes bacterium]|nr:SBBP repeat-containing protein [Bacteroidota bacterium]